MFESAFNSTGTLDRHSKTRMKKYKKKKTPYSFKQNIHKFQNPQMLGKEKQRKKEAKIKRCEKDCRTGEF